MILLIVSHLLLFYVSLAQDVTLTTLFQTSTVSLPTPTPMNIVSDARCLPGCVWDRYSLKVSSMKYFPTFCETVCAETTFTIDNKCDMTEIQLNETLKNMKHLIGGLTIRDTNFASARYLANLESIDCLGLSRFLVFVFMNGNLEEMGMANLRNVSCAISISSNANMTKLNTPNLVPTAWNVTNSTFLITISDSSPEFCITHQEMANLITYGYVRLWNVAGQYCPISSSITSSEKKTCDLQNSTWSGTNIDCVNVLGDVIIDENNEQYAGNLASVETIFGSLSINETSLRSVNFLGSLKRIISLTEDQRALTVEGNTLMTNVTLPSIEKVYARSFTSIQFDNNSLELVKDPSFCYGIRNNIELYHFRIVLFDDKSCEEVQRYADTLKSSKRNFLNPVLIALALVGAVINS